MAGRLIEDEDAGIFQDDTGDGHPLLLPTGKPVAPLSYHRVIPTRQPGDELVDVGSSASRFQLSLGRVGVSV